MMSQNVCGHSTVALVLPARIRGGNGVSAMPIGSSSVKWGVSRSGVGDTLMTPSRT